MAALAAVSVQLTSIARSSNWHGLLVSILLFVPVAFPTSGVTVDRLNFGTVFTKKVTLNIEGRYILQNISLPVPTPEDFHPSPRLCEPHEEGCYVDALVAMVVEQIHAHSQRRLQKEIHNLLSILGPHSAPDNGSEHYKPPPSSDPENFVNETRTRHSTAEGREVLLNQMADLHWLAVIGGDVPYEQLPTFVQHEIMFSLKAQRLWNEYVKGFHQVLRGQLHRGFLSEATLTKKLQDVKDFLYTKNYRFRLVEPEAEAYFRERRVKGVFLDGDKLLVTLSLPVTTGRTLYDVYEAKIFPLLHRSTVILSTRLVQVPRYLAVARDGARFLEMNRLDFSQCTETEEKVCFASLSSTTSQEPSCLLNVFKNHVAGVRSSCQFDVQEKTFVQPSVLEVTPGLALWANATPHILIDCPPRVRRSYLYPECLQCTRYVPCQCTARTPNAELPPRLRDCQENPPVTESSPVSLGLWLRLLPAEELKGLNGSSSMTPTQAEKFQIPSNASNRLKQENSVRPITLTLDEMQQFFDDMSRSKNLNAWMFSDNDFDTASYVLIAMTALAFVVMDVYLLRLRR